MARKWGEGARNPQGILLLSTAQGLEGSQAVCLLRLGNVPKKEEAAAPHTPSQKGGADASAQAPAGIQGRGMAAASALGVDNYSLLDFWLH